MAYVVKAACAVVKGAGYLYRGALVPESADVDDVERLVAEGLLTQDEDSEVVTPAPKSKPAPKPKPEPGPEGSTEK